MSGMSLKTDFFYNLQVIFVENELVYSLSIFHTIVILHRPNRVESREITGNDQMPKGNSLRQMELKKANYLECVYVCVWGAGWGRCMFVECMSVRWWACLQYDRGKWAWFAL